MKPAGPSRINLFILPFSLSIALFLWSAPACPGGELSQPLRQASELYRTGHLEEARREALIVHHAFPHDLEALLLLGRIDFERRDLARSKEWFRLASAEKPRHPLVVMYRKVFEEIEYRKGPLNATLLPLPDPDKTVTAERFRKGWFGPSTTLLSEPVKVEAEGPPPLPGVERPTLQPLVDESVRQAAQSALDRRLFLKAYLLFHDLLLRNPGHPPYLLAQAKAAYGMGRYGEATAILKRLSALEPAWFPPVGSGPAAETGFSREKDEAFELLKRLERQTRPSLEVSP